MWGGGKKRPRSTVTRQPDWSGRDRIPRPCELQSHTPGLPNYERASIALAPFYEGKGAGVEVGLMGVAGLPLLIEEPPVIEEPTCNGNCNRNNCGRERDFSNRVSRRGLLCRFPRGI